MPLPLLLAALALAGGTFAKGAADASAARTQRHIIQAGRDKAQAEQRQGLQTLQDSAKQLDATQRLDTQQQVATDNTNTLTGALADARAARDTVDADANLHTPYATALNTATQAQRGRENKLAGFLGALRAGNDLRLREGLSLGDAQYRAGQSFGDARKTLSAAVEGAGYITPNPVLKIGGEILQQVGAAGLSGGLSGGATGNVAAGGFDVGTGAGSVASSAGLAPAVTSPYSVATSSGLMAPSLSSLASPYTLSAANAPQWVKSLRRGGTPNAG